MATIVQSSLPVVSTKHFSFGPNEHLSVQDFLRDLTRSSRAVKANLRPPDQACSTPQKKPLTLPRILGDAANPNQIEPSPPNISRKAQPPLLQRLPSEKSNTSEQDVLRPDSYPNLGFVNTKSPRIIHTYSRKSKGTPPEPPTSEIVPPPSPPCAAPEDQHQNASVRTGSELRARDPGELKTHLDGPLSIQLPKTADTANLESLKRKSKRTARCNDNAEEQRTAKGNKRRRRLPVEGLVLVHGICAEEAYPPESEVSCGSSLPAFGILTMDYDIFIALRRSQRS